MYDGVFRLRLPNGTAIVSFADNITIVSVAKTVSEIKEKTNAAIRNVAAWLDEAGVTLADRRPEDSGEDGRWIELKSAIK